MDTKSIIGQIAKDYVDEIQKDVNVNIVSVKTEELFAEMSALIALYNCVNSAEKPITAENIDNLIRIYESKSNTFGGIPIEDIKEGFRRTK